MNDHQPGDFSTEVGVETIVELLVIATLVALITKRIRVPYTIALVLVGLTVGFTHLLHPIGLSPEIILLIFLPPLLFEGTIAMNLNILREKWREVLLLAFPVTLLCAFSIGAVAHYIIGYQWPVALLLGAILSPTDPISVLALFKELGVSKKLSVIIEGESCFNDGVGVVLFLILSRIVSGEEVSVGSAIALFGMKILGGAAVGIALGYLVYRMLRHIDDHLVEVTISVALAFGAYILAERLTFSGVFAVVFSGLIIGNFGRVFSMSPGTRLTLSSFWEVMSFLANSLLFLLMGIAVESVNLGRHIATVILLFLTITVARIILVYLSGFIFRLGRRPLAISWQHTIAWSGLRGSIPVALVLGVALPAAPNIPSREEFLALVIGVVTFSLLVQGLSIKPLMTWLKLVEKDESEEELEICVGRRIALQAALVRLDELNASGQVDCHLFEELSDSLKEQLKEVSDRTIAHVKTHPELARTRRNDVMRAIALAERAALEDATVKGLISEEALSELKRDVDSRIELGEDVSTEVLSRQEKEECPSGADPG